MNPIHILARHPAVVGTLLVVASAFDAGVSLVCRSGDRLDAEPARLDELEKRLIDLRSRADALLHAAKTVALQGTAPEDGSKGSRDSKSSIEEAVLARIAGRLSTLEGMLLNRNESSLLRWNWSFGGPDGEEIPALLALLEQGNDEFPHIEWLGRIGDACSVQAVARLEALAKNPTASVDARCEATEALQQLGNLLGLGQALVDEELCRSIVDCAQEADAESRRKLYSALNGVTGDFLRKATLDAARNDSSAAVRERVIRNLNHFLPDPEVEALLRWSQANDPSVNVRKVAEGALERKR